MPPLDIPQPGMKPDRVQSPSGIGSIDSAKPPTPKRERTYTAFMETMVGYGRSLKLCPSCSTLMSVREGKISRS